MMKGNPMNASECMSPAVAMVSPEHTVAEAVEKMERHDCGSLPVAQGDRLVGMVTDRDIALRAIGAGRDANTPVSQVMSSEVKYCFAETEIDDLLANFGDQQLRRMPVVDNEKRLVGIISLSDVVKEAEQRSGEALAQITQPSAHHNQKS